MSERTDKIAFYAKNEAGKADELILDFFEREYEFSENLTERDLWARHGGSGREFAIEPAGLNKLLATVEDAFPHGTFFTGPKSYAVRQKDKQQDSRELVPKERIGEAIRWECGEEELRDLCSRDKYRFEKDRYFDLDLITEKIRAFMAGKKSVEYFTSWLILLMRCLEESMLFDQSRQHEIYCAIADRLDGEAWMPSDLSDEEKRSDCLELIAVLKDFDHRLRCVEAEKNIPFAKNGVITYVTFAACINGDRGVKLSKVCVVDEDRKTGNFLYVPDIVYREEIAYTFLTEAQFDRLLSTYCEYMFDGTMKEDHAMTKTDR